MTDRASPVERVRTFAPWLLGEELGTCVVGSAALAEACRRAGTPPPPVADLDLAWAPSIADAEAELRRRDVFISTTEANRGRGTLALELGGERVEITSFRESGEARSLEQRIRADLSRRDMTVGAIAWQLATDVIHDPFGGLAHWRDGRIEPVGDPRERVDEHPVRWIRYFRRAHQWGFELSPAVRKLEIDGEALGRIPPEAIGAELRAALLDTASPGRFLLELHEAGGLVHLAPELAPQFDGRSAGPVRHHPEVSQALHLILALEWAAAHTLDLGVQDRLAVLVATLCHDLGKGLTDPGETTSHRGHEAAGVPLVRELFRRRPGLGDARARRLAEAVCELHLVVRGLRSLRPGTLARLYEGHFRAREFPVDLFARAVAADCAGRLGRTDEGERVHAAVAADVRWLRSCCEQVDARELRRRHPETDRFRAALHEARARAIAAGLREPA